MSCSKLPADRSAYLLSDCKAMMHKKNTGRDCNYVHRSVRTVQFHLSSGLSPFRSNNACNCTSNWLLSPLQFRKEGHTWSCSWRVPTPVYFVAFFKSIGKTQQINETSKHHQKCSAPSSSISSFGSTTMTSAGDFETSCRSNSTSMASTICITSQKVKGNISKWSIPQVSGFCKPYRLLPEGKQGISMIFNALKITLQVRATQPYGPSSPHAFPACFFSYGLAFITQIWQIWISFIIWFACVSSWKPRNLQKKSHSLTVKTNKKLEILHDFGGGGP